MVREMAAPGNVMAVISSFMGIVPAVAAALPIGFLLMSSILPVVKVLLIAATGLIFAQPNIGVLNTGSRHSLSKLVFTIFLPAIIFVNLGEAITPQKLLEWWFIPVNVMITSITGCLIGIIVAKLTDVPPEFFRLTFILTGIGNMGNMPLVLLNAVCSDSRNPFGNSLSCNRLGTAYISLGMWTAALIMWIFAYNVLAPPEEWLPGYVRPPKPRTFDDEDEGSMSSRHGRPHLRVTSPARHLAATEEEEDNSEPGNGLRNNLAMAVPLIRKGLRKASEAAMTTVLESRFHYWMKTLHIYDIMRPPVLAAFLAMIMGMVPFLGYVFFNPDGALRFLTDAIGILGDAMIPCILLVLGGNLVGGPGSSRLPVRTTTVLVITRLIVIPALGILVVSTADRLGFLPPGDKMFKFVLFLQHTMPSSIQIGTACSLRGFGDKEVSAVLFYQHIAAVFTMAVYLFVYFYILFGA